MSQVEGHTSQIELLRYGRGVNVIDVLTTLRIRTRCGLREAKEAFEACEQGHIGVLPTPSLDLAHQLADELQTLGVTSRVSGQVYGDLSAFEAPAWVHQQKGVFALSAFRLVGDKAVLEGSVHAGTLRPGDTLAVRFLDNDIVSLPVTVIEPSDQDLKVIVEFDVDESINDLLVTGDHLLILAPANL